MKLPALTVAISVLCLSGCAQQSLTPKSEFTQNELREYLNAGELTVSNEEIQEPPKHINFHSCMNLLRHYADTEPDINKLIITESVSVPTESASLILHGSTVRTRVNCENSQFSRFKGTYDPVYIPLEEVLPPTRHDPSDESSWETPDLQDEPFGSE